MRVVTSCITTAWFCCVWVYSSVHGASAAHGSACPWLTGDDGTPPAPHGSAGWMLPPPLRSTQLRRAQKNYTWYSKSDHKAYDNNWCSHININRICTRPAVIEYFTPVAPRDGETGIKEILQHWIFDSQWLIFSLFPPQFAHIPIHSQKPPLSVIWQLRHLSATSFQTADHDTS